MTLPSLLANECGLHFYLADDIHPDNKQRKSVELNGRESVSNDEYNRDDIKTQWKRKDHNNTINV